MGYSEAHPPNNIVLTNPVSTEQFTNVITGTAMALYDAIGSIFNAAGTNKTIGLVPLPDSTANTPPKSLGDDAAWHTASSLITSAPAVGGRLTFASVTPVMTTTINSASSHYWTPYIGQLIPLWNGTNFSWVDVGGELSQLCTDTTKSPAAVVASTIYDVFVWSDSGTYRATRGPAWSNSGAGTGSRGSGAGTSELQLVNGVYTNKNAITNGPAAGYGTYVGTYLSDGSATLSFIFGTSASGGVAANLYCWNNYNRRNIGTVVNDTTAYTYTALTVRPSHNSVTNRVAFVVGVLEEAYTVQYQMPFNTTANAGAAGGILIGVNSTTTADPNMGAAVAQTPAAGQMFLSLYCGGTKLPTQIGYNYIQALESSDGSHANGFNTQVGNANFDNAQAGLSFYLDM